MKMIDTEFMPNWLRFEDAMKYSSMTKHQLRPLLQDRRVYGKKVGKIWLVNRESLDDYLNSDRTKARLVVRSVLG